MANINTIFGFTFGKTPTVNTRDLVLDPKMSFDDHLALLVKIDKINDRNAKKLYKSAEDLLAWINSRHELDKVWAQVSSYMHLAERELPAKEFEKCQKKYIEAAKAAGEVNVNEDRIIIKHKTEIKRYLHTPLLQRYIKWFETTYFCDAKHQANNYKMTAWKEIRGTQLIHGLFETAIKEDFNLVPPTDKNGKYVTGAVIYDDFYQNKDPEVRKRAWINYLVSMMDKYNLWGEFIAIKMVRLQQLAGYCKFKSIFDLQMHSLKLNVETGNILYDAFKSCQKEFEWFAEFQDKIKMAQNNLQEMVPWERKHDFVYPTVGGLTVEDAKRDIAHCLSILGPEYSALVKKVFDEEWIDWYGKSKVRDDFSCAAAGNRSYPIKTNFKGDAYDAVVVAHEMGHSIAAEFSKKNGVYHGFHDVLSEIPSFVNETLMYLYYINHKYRENQNLEHFDLAYHWMQRLFDDMLGISLRQTVVNAVETELAKTQCMNTTRIMQIYRELKAKYGVMLPDDKKWLNSEQFKFYDVDVLHELYSTICDTRAIKYLFGSTIGVCIAVRIFNDDENKEFTKKYIQYLKSGTAKNPIELLKDLGFDITESSTYDPASKICRQLISILRENAIEGLKRIKEGKLTTRPKSKKTLVVGDAPKQTGKKTLIIGDSPTKPAKKTLIIGDAPSKPAKKSLKI